MPACCPLGHPILLPPETPLDPYSGLLVALERQAGSDGLASWLWGPLLACYSS